MSRIPVTVPRVREPCNVGGPHCSHPPELSPPRTPRSECFGCGLKVCTKCSKRRPWYRYGVRRICTNCVIDHLGEEAL